MFNQTTDDLRLDALWRAGEPQTTFSSFWAKSLEYINRIYQGLILGGNIVVGRDLATSAGLYSHVFDLPITDWWWARKLGVLTTVPFIDVSATFTAKSREVIFSPFTLPQSPELLAHNFTFVGWRIFIPGQIVLPRIAVVTEMTATSLTVRLDGPWPEETFTGGVSLYQEEYALPFDFVRFTSPFWNHSTITRQVPVGSREQFMVTGIYPFIRQGPPTAAFQTGPQTVIFDNFDSEAFRMEFEYIAMPDFLESGTIPLLAPQHRSILSVGAAMLMCFDKSDTKAEQLASEYREYIMRMTQEHRKAMSSGSNVYGMHLPRAGYRRTRAQQPSGEIFLT